MARAGAWAWALCAVGCSGTSFNVNVVDARRERPIEDASVLMYDAQGDPCRDAAAGGQRSDRQGTAHVQAPWCGEARLVVAAAGYRPHARALDSCGDAPVTVALEPWPAPSPGSESPEAQTARAFLEAIMAKNAAAVGELLADREQAGVYLESPEEICGRECTIRFAQLAQSGEPAVTLETFAVDGCRKPWVIRLTRVGDALRVVALDRGR